MSPALEHRLSTALAATADVDDDAARAAIGVDPAVAQIALRLAHDLRRLKEIKATDLKIAAKREMIPDYREWCDLRLAAGAALDGRDLPSAGADDVLPTVMVWALDTGDWSHGLELAEHVLRFGIALPARYNRDAATVIVDLTADAALAAQQAKQRFPLKVLERVEELTADVDMHDQPRAKLAKAIAQELIAEADATTAGPLAATFLSQRALELLRRALMLDTRSGVKGLITRLEKALGAHSAITEQTGLTPAA
ncbi:phage terminase small subunit [Sphingomonas melonis]|uniref:phage terminase small subunit n=1 Tax=Sphingomonas melonis TaxID=152682 RepID=UPI00035E0E19|nr:phage terminase small subunit [Sphingomonas melonis]